MPTKLVSRAVPVHADAVPELLNFSDELLA
jgi:hypothetical protein